MGGHSEQGLNAERDDRQALKGSLRPKHDFGEPNGKGVWEEPRVDPAELNPSKNFLAVCIVALAYGLIRLLYRLRVTGREHLPKTGPYIVAANHQTFMDVPIIVHLVRPWPHMLAKRDLFRKHFRRHFFYWLGAIPVDQGRSAIQTFKRVVKVFRKKGVIGIFPEGTRLVPAQRPGDVQAMDGVTFFAEKFKCPIVPVGIERPFRLFRRNRVVFGQPLTTGDLRSGLSRTDDAALSARLMCRVYALIDHEFYVEDDSLREELNQLGNAASEKS